MLPDMPLVTSWARLRSPASSQEGEEEVGLRSPPVPAGLAASCPLPAGSLQPPTPQAASRGHGLTRRR